MANPLCIRSVELLAVAHYKYKCTIHNTIVRVADSIHRSASLVFTLWRQHIQCASGGWRFLRIFNKPPHCSTNCDAIPPAEDQALCSVSKIFMRTLSFSPPSSEFCVGEMHRWDQKITGENWFWSQCAASSPRQKMTRSALVFISIHCIQAGCGLLSSGGCGPTLHSTPTVPIIAGYSTPPLIPVTTRLRSLQVAGNKTLSL